MNDIDARLRELDLSIPDAPGAVANYSPFVQSGSQVHVSGQVSRLGDEVIQGAVGRDLDTAEAARGARLCGLNLLSQMKAACGGDLSRVRRIIKLNVFVQAAADFMEVSVVADGCVDILTDVFGAAGRPARTSVGVYRLPMNYAVEADAIFEIAPE